MRESACAFGAVLFAAAAAMAEPAPLSWESLIDDAAQHYEDPYRNLGDDQLDSLRMVVRVRERIASKCLSDEERAGAEAQLDAAEAALATARIDADWLLSQRRVVAERRERAATAGNSELDGETVTLAGFVIPAPPAEDGSAGAYLVPEQGMCSHMPPPPPNQIVRLRITDGWALARIYQPVLVTGPLAIAPSEQRMRLIDGMVTMQATYSMEVGAMQTTADRSDRKTRQLTSWARSAGGRPVDQRSSEPTSTDAR